MGTTGLTLICETCSCQFTAEPAPTFDELELTLAPLDELPTLKSSLAPSATGNADSPLHLAEEVSQPDRPCKQCDELIEFDAIACPHCGFNFTLGRNFNPAELDPYHGVYGFDRYLMRHTQDNNTGGLMLWLHVFIAFVAIVTMLLWKGWTYFIVPVILLAYIVYRVNANHTNAFQRGKGLIPRLLLLYNRVTTWKGFVSGDNSDNDIVSMRSPYFNDNSIASIENPQSIEILDIAGSAVTDNGIRYLATFSNLRALVVVSCSVAEQALDELQAALPGVCIWRP